MGGLRRCVGAAWCARTTRCAGRQWNTRTRTASGRGDGSIGRRTEAPATQGWRLRSLRTTNVQKPADSSSLEADILSQA
eukprot:1305302-Pyramimonas_sp.AAC.1